MSSDTVSIKVDTRNLRMLAEVFGGRQAEYAISRALNDVAKFGQKRTIDTLPGSTTQRTGWTPRGIRIQPCRKTGPKVAYVGSRDLTMAQMATGGQRGPHGEGGQVAIPMLGKGGRPSKTTPAKRSMFPGALIRKGKGALFVGHINGTLGVWKKVGAPQPRQRARTVLGKFRGPGTSVFPSRPLELVYALKPQAEMTADSWPFGNIVRYAVAEEWEPACERALREVVMTARRRAIP